MARKNDAHLQCRLPSVDAYSAEFYTFSPKDR